LPRANDLSIEAIRCFVEYHVQKIRGMLLELLQQRNSPQLGGAVTTPSVAVLSSAASSASPDDVLPVETEETASSNNAGAGYGEDYSA
jgi:hypothetical protein